MTDFNNSLGEFRYQIDAIDEQIIDLLTLRSAVVEQVGALKKSHGEKRSFIRPKREADMIRNIVSRFEDTEFSPEAAANIWRNIIGASLSMESPLNIAAHCPDGSLVPYFLAREYFGSFIPTAIFQHIEQMIEAIEQNHHSIGVVSLNDQSSTPPWWIQLAISDIQPNIFACIPFVQRLSGSAAENPFLAIGQVEVEETDSDISYLVSSFEYPHPNNAGSLLSKWLTQGDFRGKAVATIETAEDKWAALIKLQGFAAPDANNGLFHELKHHLTQTSDSALIDLQFIGSHATPCIIDG